MWPHVLARHSGGGLSESFSIMPIRVPLTLIVDESVTAVHECRYTIFDCCTNSRANGRANRRPHSQADGGADRRFHCRADRCANRNAYGRADSRTPPPMLPFNLSTCRDA